MKTTYLHLVSLVFVSLFISCTHLPDTYTETNDTLRLKPDYSGITLPCNIAPINFNIENEADECITSIRSTHGKPILISGNHVRIDAKKWKDLLNANKGERLTIEVYAKKKGTWVRFPLVENTIAQQPVDQYVVYRYIQPLYTLYEEMSINQRNLENFDVTVIYDNRNQSTDLTAQCVNCHSFQNYNQDGSMQMHMRGENGCTLFMRNGQYTKINLKNPSLVGGAVYPSWHPTQNLIAYSVNNIGQNFYSKKLDKVEVIDDKSDLVLYDVDNNSLSPIEITEDWLETFPYWSPDGKTLYYASAHFKAETDNTERETIEKHASLRYNLVKKPFDPTTRTFGKSDTVVNASSIGKSATFPRVSPDGQYMLFSMADYGNFHIWHRSSDLYLMDLKSGSYRTAEELNSPEVESYHSWSSNGKWVIFSSRRDDAGFTRLYLAYFDGKGGFSKPFIIPQEDPSFYDRSFKSYNVPEFIVKPASMSRKGILKAMKSSTTNAKLQQ